MLPFLDQQVSVTVLRFFVTLFVVSPAYDQRLRNEQGKYMYCITRRGQDRYLQAELALRDTGNIL